MNKIKKAEALLLEILKDLKIHIDVVDVVIDHELDTTIINVTTPEKGLFSYNNNELLKAVNHLVRRLVEKESTQNESVEDRLSYFVDINGVQARHLADIKSKTRLAMESIMSGGKTSMELEPMSSYDRLMVHTFLSSREEFKTESVGEGYDRRVVITLNSA